LDETYPCTWYQIFDRSFKMGREEMLLEVLPPLDWDQVGTETWGQVYQQVKKVGVGTFVGGMLSQDNVKRELVWDAVFRPVRQPEWWGGDAEFHPPAYEEPVSDLERRLRDGEFVIATEISPPASMATGKLRREIDLLKPYVAAINFTDGASATPRMSSFACGQVALEHQAEPVLQIAARDTTRTGLQSMVVGASALGIKNILCVSGDSARVGPSPMARIDQLDIDSVQMLWILRKLRDEGRYLDGRAIKHPPSYFLGAAASPFASETRFQALREEKKVNAGAQFFQTNLVFDTDRLDDWLDDLGRRQILGKVFILIGLTPLRSARMAEYLHYKVPGVRLPENTLQRMQDAGDGGEEEGVQIALEIIEALKEKGCINGIHLMPVGWEPIVPRLLEETGLHRRDFLAKLQDCV
jgi:methylenetetrahydrofolate reductase (NADPH)